MCVTHTHVNAASGNILGEPVFKQGKCNWKPEKTAVTRKGCCNVHCKRVNVVIPHAAMCGVKHAEKPCPLIDNVGSAVDF